MGIEASYRRIIPSEWEKLQGLALTQPRPSPIELEEAYLEFAYADELTSSAGYLSIEKEWHALHVLLTGDVSNPEEIKPFPPPLGNAVMGGTETPFNATYGMVRFLTPIEVREVADAIGTITVDVLKSRFDPAAFAGADIYANPGSDDWDDEQWEALRYYYSQLVDFFGEAAREGNVVLLSFD